MEKYSSLKLLDVGILLSIAHVTVAVLDLNPRQIQFVADHLTDEKCTKLLEALHQKGFELKPHHVTTASPSAEMNTEQRPCVVQLTQWAKGPGRTMTFDFLVLRLKEIGMTEIADRLSESVLQETSSELHQYFLDDPFKDLLPKDPIIVDKTETTTKLFPPVNGGDKEDKLFTTVVVLLALLVTLGLVITVCLGCPKAGHFVCLRACPAQCSVCYDLLVDGCHSFWYGSLKTADKYLFVTPRGSEGGFFLV